MKRFLRSIALSLVPILLALNGVSAQSDEVSPDLYKASTIPDSLKENANSVLRYSTDSREIEGPGKAIDKVHFIVTILNEKADDEAEVVLPYNKKFSTIGSFEMKVYDPDGKIIKKYHKGDMYDRAAEEDETIVTDDRLLAIRHTVSSYPTTVEITFEIDNTSLINVAEWKPQHAEQSIESEYYKVTIADTAGFRYSSDNMRLIPQKIQLNGKSLYVWQLHNLKAIKPEEGAEPWRVFPVLKCTAKSFEFYGRPGDISSWQNYGKWQQALNADVTSLPADREDAIRKMTDTIKTEKEKVRFLYNYLQQNTRYVNIVLGIGGLKPLPASFVDKNKYGDCKALSNYMHAMLNVVGIKSYYAMVTAGSNQEPADYNFPFDAFNHIILCVPMKNDTTWLECTSTTQPFGKLGEFTENRNALLITEDGGKLVNTPKSAPAENQFISNAHLTLDEDGGAKADVSISSTGEIRNMFVDGLPQLNADKQKEMILREFDIKQPVSFDYEPGKDNDGTKQVGLKFDFDKFCDIKAGDKIFYHPYALNFWDFSVPTTEKRKADYYFDYPFQGVSTTTMDLPAGFEVESLPVNQTLKFSYGDFDAKFIYDAAKNQVISVYKFNLNSQVIPAAKYTEMQEYLDAVIKAQNKKLVIKRKA